MRMMSCNGCRVLRKGCSDDCTIRPCLQWIRAPDAQANATLFLAKFYGRTGLINILSAGPLHLRPAIFRSLLYEACGRIVNPVYGSVGLLWSGQWKLCHAAVEAVLESTPIAQTLLAAATTVNCTVPPLTTYDIRHVVKNNLESGSATLHKVAAKSRPRFKRLPTTSAAHKQNGTGNSSDKGSYTGSDSSTQAVEGPRCCEGGEDLGLDLTLALLPQVQKEDISSSKILIKNS